MSLERPPGAGVKAAVIGTGFIGTVHCEAVRRAGAQLVGILASTPARSRQAAERLGTRAFDSIEDLLASDADIVHVASPNALHAGHSLEALRAGKHVVCEKPMAVGYDQALTMHTAAAEAGLIAALCYNQRFYPQIHQARELVAQGRIGKPHLVHGHYLQDWLLLDTDWNWRLDTSVSGPLRAVADIGSHWLDAAQFVTGSDVVAVFAELQTLHPQRRRPNTTQVTFSTKNSGDTSTVAVTSEDSALILLRFADSSRGCLVVSQVAAGHKNQMDLEVNGSTGSLQWNSQTPDRLVLGRRHGGNVVNLRDPASLHESAATITFYPSGHVEGFAETFRGLFERVYADVASGHPCAEPAYPTFSDGLRALAVEEAVLRSDQTGQWQAVTGQSDEASAPVPPVDLLNECQDHGRTWG